MTKYGCKFTFSRMFPLVTKKGAIGDLVGLEGLGVKEREALSSLGYYTRKDNFYICSQMLNFHS